MPHIALCIWIIFLGGAERLEGSVWAAWFFMPAMTAQELKFYAWLSLLLIPIYMFLPSYLSK